MRETSLEGRIEGKRVRDREREDRRKGKGKRERKKKKPQIEIDINIEREGIKKRLFEKRRRALVNAFLQWLDYLSSIFC